MDGGLLRIRILGELGTRILGEHRRRHRRQEYAYIRVQAFLEVRRGTEPRRFLRAAITSRVFTSQSTQSQADPTTEEQSEGEIKKKKTRSVRQRRVNICASLTASSSPLTLGLTVQCTVGNAHIHKRPVSATGAETCKEHNINPTTAALSSETQPLALSLLGNHFFCVFIPSSPPEF